MIIARRFDISRLLTSVGPTLGVMLLYDIAIAIAYVYGHFTVLGIDDLPLPLFGTAIGLMLTLRNNAAYARWWEGRTLWGAVVNHSRSFARTVLLTFDDQNMRDLLVRHQVAYVHALRLHLLRRPVLSALSAYLPEQYVARLGEPANVPAALHLGIVRLLRDEFHQGRIDTITLQTLNAPLSELANAQGGLERIKNTPLPRHYSQLPRLFTVVYCLLLPLGLVPDLELYTPIGSTLIGFMFLALDRTGRDLEDPFEGTIHDVPMKAITTTIEIDLLQALGESDVPKPVQSRRGIMP